MHEQQSFHKYEQEVVPDYRTRLIAAESCVEIQAIFSLEVKKLLEMALEGQYPVADRDVSLTEDESRPFALDAGIEASPVFQAAWSNSDLPHIVGRMAETALHHYQHLQKHPEKSQLKIRR